MSFFNPAIFMPQAVVQQFPGSINPGWSFFCGLRPYTAASIGAVNAIKLRRDIDNVAGDFGFLPDGTLDVEEMVIFADGGNLYVDTIYDQTGNGNHYVATADSSEPLFYTTGLPGTSSAGMGFQSAVPLALANTVAATIPQPFTVYSRYYCSAHPGAVQVLWSEIFNSLQLSLHNGGANVYINGAGLTIVSGPATNNAWHSAYGIFNGPTSNMHVDFTDNTGNVGGLTAITTPGNIAMAGAYAGGGFGFDGYMLEFGIHPSHLSSADMNAQTSVAAAWYV